MPKETRSIIARYDPVTERYISIYCHRGGYLDHNGVLLYAHYKSLTKVDKLLKLGNLHELGIRVDFEGYLSIKETETRFRLTTEVAKASHSHDAWNHKSIGGLLERVRTDSNKRILYLWMNDEWGVYMHNMTGLEGKLPYNMHGWAPLVGALEEDNLLDAFLNSKFKI